MSETKATKVSPYAWASAGACALGIVASLLLPSPARVPALCGAIAATLGAACALSALAAFAGRSVNGVLAGFSIGFLCRTVLVAAGLLASGARGNLALVYVFSFFTLYAVTQLVEVLFVHNSSRGISGATP